MKSFSPQTILTLNSKIMEKIRIMISDTETLYVATDILKFHSHGGSDNRIFVQSNATMMLLRQKTFGGLELSMEFTILDLIKLQYVEPNSFTLYFEGKSLSFKSDKSKDICNNILYFYSLIYYHINSPNPLKLETTPPNILQFFKHTSRPNGTIITRLLTFAKIYKTKLIPFSIQFFNEFDASPPQVLKLILALCPGEPTPTYAHALGLDVDIKSVILDNFNTKFLHIFLPVFISISTSLIKISFENYRDAPSNQFYLQSSDNSKLNELSFRNCCFPVIKSVLECLKTFHGRILTLSFEKCKLLSEEIKIIFEILRKYPSFLKLKNLRFEDGSSELMDLEDFGLLLPKTRWLKMLMISKVTIDVSIILKYIFKYSVTLKNISITNSRFIEPLNDDIIIPQCITLIDISNNEVTPISMESLGKVLFKTPRSTGFTLYSTELASAFPSSLILRSFLVQDPRPVLTELRWTRNELLPEDTQLLFDFLRTQTNLRHITLTGCFVERIGESFSIFSKFIKESRLQGFDLIGTSIPNFGNEIRKFLKTLIGIPSLQIINIDKTEIGDEGLSIILKIVNSNKHMISISCDGAKSSSFENLINFYNNLYSINHISCIGVPKIDFTKFKKNINLIKNLKNKKSPVNAASRLLYYEKVANEIKETSQPKDLFSLLHESGVSKELSSNPLDELMNIMNKIVLSIKNQQEDEILGEKSEIVTTFISTLQTSNVSALSIRTKNAEKKGDYMTTRGLVKSRRNSFMINSTQNSPNLPKPSIFNPDFLDNE